MDRAEVRKLVRLAVDGEETASQKAMLERHLSAHPADRAVMDFERKLREAVGRVLGEVEGGVPGALADRVREAIGREASAPRGARAGRSSEVERSMRRRWFVPTGLAAGILVLVSAAVVIGLLVKQDRSPPPPPGVPSAEKVLQEVRAHLETRFGRAIGIPDLSTRGIELDSANWAGVAPDKSSAVYIGYRVKEGGVVDLWIREYPMSEGEPLGAGIVETGAYMIEAATSENGPSARATFVWRVGNALYLLRPGMDDRDWAAQLAREAGMPAGPLQTIP